jgi:hypothetical protein
MKDLIECLEAFCEWIEDDDATMEEARHYTRQSQAKAKELREGD